MASLVFVLLVSAQQSRADFGCCELPGGGACSAGPANAVDCEAIHGPGTTWFPLHFCDGGIVCTPKAGVPTVSEWGLGIMVLLGLTVGTIVFSRRRPVAA